MLLPLLQITCTRWVHLAIELYFWFLAMAFLNPRYDSLKLVSDFVIISTICLWIIVGIKRVMPIGQNTRISQLQHLYHHTIVGILVSNKNSFDDLWGRFYINVVMRRRSLLQIGIIIHTAIYSWPLS